MPRALLDPRSRRRATAPGRASGTTSCAAQNAKELADAGVSVQLGAHGQREGLAAHWELWMLVQGGMTPHRGAARRHDRRRRVPRARQGPRLARAGKLADLVVLDGNPLDDIRLSTKLRYVLVNGRLYESATMNEIAPEAKQRAPFWWE